MPESPVREQDRYLHSDVTRRDKKVSGIGCEVTGMRMDGLPFSVDLTVNEMEVNGKRIHRYRAISLSTNASSQICRLWNSIFTH